MKYKKGLGYNIYKIYTETQSIEDISFLLDSSESHADSWARKLQTLYKTNLHIELELIIKRDTTIINNIEIKMKTLKNQAKTFKDIQIIAFIQGSIQATDKKLKYYYI